MMASHRPGPAKGIARGRTCGASSGWSLPEEFGQSDRELIASSTKEANVAQVLEIMNGHVEKMVVSNRGAPYTTLKKGTTEADKVRYIYYAVLSRPPSDQEMNMLMRCHRRQHRELSKHRRRSHADPRIHVRSVNSPHSKNPNTHQIPWTFTSFIKPTNWAAASS